MEETESSTVLSKSKDECEEMEDLDQENYRSQENEKDMNCGWFCLEAKWLKPCSSIQFFLVVMSLTGLFHFLVPFGLTYAVLTTLEKCFHFSSTQSGYIASAYQFSAMLFTPIAGYVLENANKPVWCGIGTFILAGASVLFASPQLLADPFYATPVVGFNQSEDESIICPSWNASGVNQTGCEAGTDEYSSNFYWMFILAQILMGVAAAPFFTVGMTYLDENVKPKDFGLYLGIANAFFSAGPALGYFLGALTLSLYTDITADTESISLTPDHPLWIGAWWLGFIVAAVIVFIFGIIIMGFPRIQPGTKEIAEWRKLEAQKGSEFDKPTGFHENLMAFPKALYLLIRNPSFMGNCFGMLMEWFVITGLGVFLPKYFESQFNMSPSHVASVLGIINITAVLSGSLGSGVVIERLNLKFKGLIRTVLFCVSMSFVFSLSFLMYCPNVPFAGITQSYSESLTTPVENSLYISPCNAHCDCRSQAFDPVCGVDNVMYYSACHAGCSEKIAEDENLVYTKCKCLCNETCPESNVEYALATGIMPTAMPGNTSSYSGIPLDNSVAYPGRCSTSCNFKWPFYVLIWLVIFFNIFTNVPSYTALIRCVSHSQRAFALGVCTIIYSIGTSTAPIIFGLLIDNSCILLESLCDGSQVCWLYDNHAFALIMLGLILICKFFSLVFYGGTYFAYKPVEN